jgi:plasmid maintenance system antidote protein VapI
MKKVPTQDTLGRLMEEIGMSGGTLAKLAGTSKQQISALRGGRRSLTKQWAERLAPHLRSTWPELMGWSAVDQSKSPLTETERRLVNAVLGLSAEESASLLAFLTARPRK